MRASEVDKTEVVWESIVQWSGIKSVGKAERVKTKSSEAKHIDTMWTSTWENSTFTFNNPST